jgi:cysteine protease ATG4
MDGVLRKTALFTYRDKFEALPRSTETSDKGWGCLIRTCQMMLHRTLVVHGAFEGDEKALMLAFRDLPDENDAPFGIHNLVRAVSNANSKFQAGYWSPRQGSEAIRGAVLNSKISPPLMVHLGDPDGSLYDDEVRLSLQTAPTLILASIRTGISDRIHQQAWITFGHLLRSKHCVGIVGGSPKRSYYFIGIESERAIYLDPHVETQPAFKDEQTTGRCYETNATIMALEWKRIDASMVVGFYLRDETDWRSLTHHLNEVKRTGGAQLISVCEKRGVANVAHVDEVLDFE